MHDATQKVADAEAVRDIIESRIHDVQTFLQGLLVQVTILASHGRSVVPQDLSHQRLGLLNPSNGVEPE